MHIWYLNTKKIMEIKVLIIGLSEEIARNIILTGVK